ncbi:MAG: hypothetical protein LH649_11405 [Pseudanabaena sp. CAN_BIN31]|nr:hypothetical protein [Pseudanabaena sp. CAN_BIN31]
MICQFEKAMDNDFNTSIALSYVFELAKKLRSERNSILHSGKPQSRPSLSKQALSQALFQEWQTLKYMTDVLGFGTEVSDHQVQKDGISEADIESLIQKRIEAKKAKNYQEGDRIRNELKALNITLIDQKDGTTRWIRE